VAEWLRRYVQVVVNFVGVGSSPTGCTCLFVIPLPPKRWYSVVVSISGCDPLDPGSNPGTAKLFLCVCVCVCVLDKKREVLPGLEPGLQGSEPWVLTNYTIEPSCAPMVYR
jgi:hypothetical protein